jgi:hypothetical protein
MTNTYITAYREKQRQPVQYPTKGITDGPCAARAGHISPELRSAEVDGLESLPPWKSRLLYTHRSECEISDHRSTSRPVRRPPPSDGQERPPSRQGLSWTARHEYVAEPQRDAAVIGLGISDE